MAKKKRKFQMTHGMSVALRVAVAVIVAVVLFLMAAERLNIATVTDINDSLRSSFSGMNPGAGYPYKINSSSVRGMTVMGGDLFVLTSQDTMSLDSTANEIKRSSHTFSQPAFATRGSKAVVYNRNGNRFRVENRTDTLFTGETPDDEKIITAAIGAKGNIALATFSNDCTSKLTVYSTNYKKTVFGWNCAQDTITSVDLSDNGKYAAVCVVGARDGEIYSKVVIFDFDYSEPKAEFEYFGTAMLAVHFGKNDNVVAVGDDRISFIKGLKNKEDMEYGSSTLSNFAFSEDGNTVLALSEHGSTNNEKLYCFSPNLSKTCEKKFESVIKSLGIYKGHISVLLENQALVLKTNGGTYKKYDADNTAIAVYSIGNRTYLYTTGVIERCK